MNQEEKRALIMEFEKNRQMLAGVAQQKHQLSVQLEVMKLSVEELDKTTEKQVYKAVGNVLIPKSTEEMKKELQEKIESTDLRVKTVEKQEESLLKKLNSIKSKVEGSEKEESEDEDKKDKKSKK